MKPWRLREFHPEDLDQLVEVWQESRNPARPAVYSLSEVLSACTEQQAVVAMAGDRLIGAAAANIEEDRATNFIRALDTAFLRHGRFDYVIPIGLPDPAAREATVTEAMVSKFREDIKRLART